MLVLLGESGAGKTTIEDILISKYNMKRAISHTTRPKRENDIDGVNYHFVSEEQMQKLENDGDLVEKIEYNGNIYAYVETECVDDRVVVVIPEGLEQLNARKDLNIYSVYVTTPEVVRTERMKSRGDAISLVDERIALDREIFKDASKMVSAIVNNFDATSEECADFIYNLYLEYLQPVNK